MNKLLLVVFTVASLLMSCHADTKTSRNSSNSVVDTVNRIPENKTAEKKPESVITAKDALVYAYPDFIKSIEGNEIIFTDNSRMAWDDGRDKTFEQKLDDADPEDMFSMTYNRHDSTPEYLQDAGRSRCEALFKKMYGSSASEVQRNLVSVDWMGSKVRFTKINGGADSLRKVVDELKRHPEFKKYLSCSGTFYWRAVRGAKRLSAHSYGIAIDIGVSSSDYWLWRNPRAKETDRIKYANRIPRGIIEIFQKHGFIWGGAWYHYDTMHFEFRPEILKFSKP